MRTHPDISIPLPARFTASLFVMLPFIALLGFSVALAQTTPEALNYFRQGLDLALKKDYDRALEMYRHGVDAGHKVHRLPDIKSSQAFAEYQEAFKIRKTNPDLALKKFKSVIEKEPTNPGAYNEIGMIFYSKGMFDESIRWFEGALKASPDYVFSLENLGAAYTNQKKHREAIFFLKTALTLDPNSPWKQAIQARIAANRKKLAQ